MRLWRRTALARARGEAGDTMIEVMVAVLIVALTALAVFTGLGAATDIQGAERHQSVAIYLAQQDQQRLRGLTVQQLTSTTTSACTATIPQTGNGCYTEPYDGETYTITSSAQFYTASGSTACTTSSSSSADDIPITSVVQWANNNDGRKPVEEHGIVTPAAGGQIVATVTDSVGSPTAGLSNVAVTITGPGTSTATQTLNTDANGCAIFIGENPGTYTVSETLPSPYLPAGGSSTKPVIVVNGASAQANFSVAQAATVNAGFTTQINGGTAQSIPFDTFSLDANSGSSETSYGTAGNPSPPSTVTTGATVYPYGTGKNYAAFAGTCAADDPGSPGTVPPDTPVALSDGGTASPTVRGPSMLLGRTSSFTNAGGTTWVDDSNSSVTYAQGTGSSNGWTLQGSTPGDFDSGEHYTNVANNTASYTFTGTSITWVTKLYPNHGYADVYIDGNDVAHNINTYSASTVYQYQAFTYVWPTSGTHTINSVDDSGVPPGSSGTYIVSDAFIVGTYTQTQVPNTSSSITYAGTTWGTYTNSNEYSGSEHNNSVAGSTASLTFTGTSVAWITSEWPDHGEADVYMDLTDVAQNIDTYAPSATFQVEAFQESWASSGTHTIEVYVDGKHDASSTGNNVAVDEFIVTSPTTTAAVTSWPSGWSIVTYDSCSPAVERFPSNPVATSSFMFPVAAPYGASTQVCIANSNTSTDTGLLPSSGDIANTDFTGSTPTSLTLPTTNSGPLSSAAFGNSGACPP